MTRCRQRCASGWRIVEVGRARLHLHRRHLLRSSNLFLKQKTESVKGRRRYILRPYCVARPSFRHHCGYNEETVTTALCNSWHCFACGTAKGLRANLKGSSEE